MASKYYDILFEGETYDNLPKTRRDIDDLDELKKVLEAEFDRDAYGWQDEETGETHHVGEVIDALIDHLYDGEYTGDEETFLDLRIQEKGIKGAVE